MALIKCPDCNKEVSDAAPSCIHCGRPLKASPANGLPSENVVPIEQTGKNFKIAQLLGGLMIFLGLVSIFSGSSEVAVGLWVIGLCLALYGSIGGWWYHG